MYWRPERNAVVFFPSFWYFFGMPVVNPANHFPTEITSYTSHLKLNMEEVLKAAAVC